MKKVLWVVFASVVAVPALCAQSTLQLEGAIKKAIAQKVMLTQQKPATKADVLNLLEGVRSTVAREYDAEARRANGEEERMLERESIVMQSIVRLADFFIPYVQAGNNDVRELVYEIERPIQAGSRTFVISQLADDFAGVRSHEWGAQDPVEELAVFTQILKQYPPMTEQEFQEYKAMQRSLGHFRSYVGRMQTENPLMVMQAAVYMADVFFDEYAQNPGEKTDRFVAKNPKLAASVAREINEPIQAGWDTNKKIKIADYIGTYIYQADQTWKSPAPAEELDIFAKFLVKASKEK